MTEPRTGDTVHYRSAAEDPACWAAIICVARHDGTVNLAVYSADGTPTPRLNVPADPDEFTDGEDWYPPGDFTPGTWHHIH